MSTERVTKLLSRLNDDQFIQVNVEELRTALRKAEQRELAALAEIDELRAAIKQRDLIIIDLRHNQKGIKGS